MKKIIRLLAISLGIFGFIAISSASGRVGMRDCDYDCQDNSINRDFDNDGIPNAVDPYDNDWYKPDTMRDFDNDGIPNAVDPYDNDWYK